MRRPALLHFAGGAMIAVISLVSGCWTSLKSTSLDASGHFQTGISLSPDNIKHVEPFSDRYRRLAYVRFDGPHGDSFNEFIVQSLRNMHSFCRVMQAQEVETQARANGLLKRREWDSTEPEALARLQNALGPFLLVQVTLTNWHDNAEVFYSSLVAIDSSSGRTVFNADRKVFNWAGLDQPLLYPLLNGFIDWTRSDGGDTQSRCGAAPPG